MGAGRRQAPTSERWLSGWCGGTKRADVAAIGYGFAGVAAAVTAHDAGARVIVLEKAPEAHKGGNSSEEMIQVWATEMHANRARPEGLGMKARALAALPSAEFPDLDGSDCVQTLVRGDGTIGDERLWRGVTKPAMAARGIRVLYETAAVRLVKDGGEIVGVIAERRGTPLAIKANRAVILACGGFENNPTTIRTYLTGLPRLYPSGTPYNTGDGVRMGLEVGADLWHMSNICGAAFVFKAEGIRKAGPIGQAHADWDVRDGGRYAWSDDNLCEVDKGWIRRATTVRDLAGLVHVSPDALEVSVLRFNGFADAGHDADFGRGPARPAALISPPYYPMALMRAFINTQGGPRRNKDAQVVDAHGRLIPRLYLAGELGSIYAFLYQGGGNIGECLVCGRIASANAALEEPLDSETPTTA